MIMRDAASIFFRSFSGMKGAAFATTKALTAAEAFVSSKAGRASVVATLLPALKVPSAAFANE
jgi:hypothetical protein